MNNQPTFETRKRFLMLDAADEQALAKLHSAFGANGPGFVDGFYRHLMAYPQMRTLLPDGQALEQLKRLHTAYFQRLTAGDYGPAYAQNRERVGLTHARIGLPPGWYLGAYSHYLCELLPQVAGFAGLSPHEQTAALRALVKVIFLDMGIAIDTYMALRDELIAELRDYSAAFAHLPYGTLVVTAQMEVVFASQAFGQWLDVDARQLADTPLQQWLETGSLPRLVHQALRAQPAQDILEVRPLAQRLALPVAVTAHALPAQQPEAAARVLLTVQNLREQKQLQRDLVQAQEVANIGTWHTALDGRFDLTPQAARILGGAFGPEAGAGQLLDCVHPQDRALVQAKWQASVAQGAGVFLIRTCHTPLPRWVEVRCAFENDAQGIPVRGYGTVLDITERHLAEDHIRHLALFDALTGLANRQHGLDLLDGLLHQAHAQGGQVALIFIDLDRFKEINDTLGHSMGDRVLQAIARQAQTLLRPGDVLARLGGDEFMLARLLQPGDGPLALAAAMDALLQQPLQIDDRAWGIGGSVGVALYPDHADNVSALLHCADLAMYQVKARNGGYLMYEAGMSERHTRSIAVAQRLKLALTDGQLALHYQPKVDIATGQLRGVEALARWHDAEWGWVSPGEFIPVAEERGLISALDAWCLESAARQWRQWHDAGWAEVPTIAVNISAVEISLQDGFADRALALVQRHGVPPSAIELEITETALMCNAEKAEKTSRRLVEMGFSLAIDDFGTGYSSLARLHKLPLSRLKIDMAFIANMLADVGSMAIVTAVISMARALQLRTVAEGVETAEQFDTLRSLLCDEVQGYLCSRPLPPSELEQRWLRRASRQEATAAAPPVPTLDSAI